jgi:hypothetical protein
MQRLDRLGQDEMLTSRLFGLLACALLAMEWTNDFQNL